MNIYWLDYFNKGNIGMMARPKGNDWLEDEINNLQRQSVNVVVSLLTKKEELELEIEREQYFCKKSNIKFLIFPILDRGLPSSKIEFRAFIIQINKLLNQNNKIVVHCRMGIGRTSLVASALLLLNGMKITNVFDFLSEKRTLSVPDTDEQIN